jgi:septum formation protein
MREPRLILASASARRAQLLLQIGVPYEVQPAQLAEHRAPGEPIAACVQRLAEDKAREVLGRLGASRAAEAADGRLVLGADTAVALDGQMLGKPRDEQHGMQMLASLSARTHEVLSAVALADTHGVRSLLSVSQVRLRRISPEEAARYWASGEPCDKAGGYAIQGLGAIFVETLQGSYSGVMGLPLFETAALLAQSGVRMWRTGM